MTDDTRQSIPASTSRWLGEVPTDRPVALLLRHSVRDELAPGDVGYARPINALGERLAREFGTALQGRLRALHSSPVQRCLHTAEILREAANPGLEIVQDRMLGDPGAYVLDAQLAWKNWERLGSLGIMEHLVSTNEPLPGTAPADVGARALVRHMLAVAGIAPGLHVFVTHDILVAATAARFLGTPAGPARWPRYLEAAFFWRDAAGLHAAYREQHRHGIADLS